MGKTDKVSKKEKSLKTKPSKEADALLQKPLSSKEILNGVLDKKDKESKKASSPAKDAVAKPEKSKKAGKTEKPPAPKPAVPAVAATKVDKKDKKKKVPEVVQPPPQTATSGDSDSSSDDDDTPPPVSKQSPTKVPLPQNDSSSDDSDSEEEEKPKAQLVKKAPAPVKSAIPSGKPAVQEDSSSDDSDSESDSEEKPSKPVNGKSVAAPATSKAKDDSSDEDSDVSSSDDAEKPATAAIAKAPAAAVPSKAAAKSESGSDSDSDGSDSSSDSGSEDEDGDGDIEMKDASSGLATGKRKHDATEAPATKKVKLANGDASPAAAEDGEVKTVFVGKLSWNVDNDWLSQEFSGCGEVESARVMMDRSTGRSKGFAYVDFKTAAAAKKAVAEMNEKEVDGRAINVDFASARQPNPGGRAKAFNDQIGDPTATLFVGNLSFQSTEDSLWNAFSEHGSINSVRMPTDRDTGAPKGFGYIEFADVDSAKKALDALNQTEIDGRRVRLDYSQPRDASGGGGRGGGRGGFGDRGGRGGGRGGFGDRGGRGGGRGGFGDRGGRGGRGGGRGGFGDRGGRGGRGRGGPPRSGAHTGGIAEFSGNKVTF